MTFMIVGWGLQSRGLRLLRRMQIEVTGADWMATSSPPTARPGLHRDLGCDGAKDVRPQSRVRVMCKNALGVLDALTPGWSSTAVASSQGHTSSRTGLAGARMARCRMAIFRLIWGGGGALGQTSKQVWRKTALGTATAKRMKSCSDGRQCWHCLLCLQTSSQKCENV